MLLYLISVQAADIIEQLESCEFHELDPAIKLQILVGFCHRIMASYSVQDFMDEKQQDVSEMWFVLFVLLRLQFDVYATGRGILVSV